MAPKSQELTNHMRSLEQTLKAQVADGIGKMDENTAIGRTMKSVQRLVRSANASDARLRGEPTPPDGMGKLDIGKYLKVKLNGEERPISSLLIPLHDEGAHSSMSKEMHKKFHKEIFTSYFFNPEKKTWIEHLFIANSYNMDLAYFDTLEEQKIGEKEVFEKNPNVDSVFIGGAKGYKNNWFWVYKKNKDYDTIPIKYSFWNKGEPNNAGNRENVIQLYKNGKLFYAPHTTQLPALWD